MLSTVAAVKASDLALISVVGDGFLNSYESVFDGRTNRSLNIGR
jgi:hypothetical protein